MLDQVGPQRFWHELKAEAPHYAKLLPALPRLVDEFLRRVPKANSQPQRELMALLQEQRRTNRLLQSIVYGGLGFVLGLLVMQLFVRMRLF